MKVDLRLEIRGQADKTTVAGGALLAPQVDEDYWAYRVKVSDKQAVVGFPKFGTIGIGFAVEEDWNTNLPYSCDVDTIFRHIAHNKGDDSISDEDCREAIRMIKDTVRATRER